MAFSFRIAEAQRHDAIDLDDFLLIASCSSGVEEAKLAIWLKSPEDVVEDFIVPIAFSTGHFRRIGGPNPDLFFAEMANAFEIHAPRRSVDRLETLPFEFIFMGPPAERDPEGGFSDEPGDWILTKLFVAGGRAKLFFNFNLVTGEAEFQPKAPEYAEVFVQELSKILW
jgi:hypothetical protein